jgi:hypothetical protein
MDFTDVLQTLITQSPLVGVLAYMYLRRDRDYRELAKRYRDDLRHWANLPPDEDENGDLK